MRDREQKKRWSESKNSGMTLVVMAITLSLMFAVMGLAIEVAGFYSVRRHTQTAADAGAKAGATELWRGGTNATILTAAQGGATQNGYTNGANGATVTVNIHRADGWCAAYGNISDCVEAIVTQAESMNLMRVFTNTQST